MLHQWSFSKGDAKCRNLLKCLDAMQQIVDAVGVHGIGADEIKTANRKSVITGKLDDGIEDRVSTFFDGTITDHGTDAGEAFVFPGAGSNVCETDGKPYDLLVLACLTVAKVTCREWITVTTQASPGRLRLAADLANEVLGGDFPPLE